MLRPREDLLQFIWKHRLLIPGPLSTVSGSTLKVIKPGEINTDSGPDFFNGLIELNGVSLAGNIEIHTRTSDWRRHGHENDSAYDTIILHVVFEHDVDLPQNTRHSVEVLELRNLITPHVLKQYVDLASSAAELPCAAQLHTVSDERFLFWLTRMRVERLEHKIKKIETLFTECDGDYARLMYILLLSNFGFRINALPFELIARHLPLQILLRHRDQLKQTEALLLGTAGFLDEQLNDRYLLSLQNEYMFLRVKYKLFPLDKSIFKLSRMRPANFPPLRLAQFAAFIHKNPLLLTNPVAETNGDTIKKILISELSSYWQKHYTTGGKKSLPVLRLGGNSAENIIINTLAPFFFFYGKKTNSSDHTEVAIRLLEYCAPENNVKTRHFRSKRKVLKSGADSQGLLNLFDNYCSVKKCLSCGIGTWLISSATPGTTPHSKMEEPGFLYL